MSIICEGNSSKYDLINVTQSENSSLSGSRICFLGSSVTLGAASENISFADYIAKRSGAEYLKEAVNGTTLVDDSADSYISRLKTIDKNHKFNLFVCQLSTNDATQHKPLGSFNSIGNTHTVCGAIDFIVDYVRKTWNCPVVFYTNAYYPNAEYAAMAQVLKNLSEQKNFGVIDLFFDTEFNNIDEKSRRLFMADEIHPTKAGYLLWWTPFMEKYLAKYLQRAN